MASRTLKAWFGFTVPEVMRPVIKTSDNTVSRLQFLELGVPAMPAAQADAATLKQHALTASAKPEAG